MNKIERAKNLVKEGSIPEKYLTDEIKAEFIRNIKLSSTQILKKWIKEVSSQELRKQYTVALESLNFLSKHHYIYKRAVLTNSIEKEQNPELRALYKKALRETYDGANEVAWKRFEEYTTNDVLTVGPHSKARFRKLYESTWQDTTTTCDFSKIPSCTRLMTFRDADLLEAKTRADAWHEKQEAKLHFKKLPKKNASHMV